jgi:hypothetical protein
MRGFLRENTIDAVHLAFLHTIVSGAVFTDEFGVLPELEFAETPVGIIYIATRRVGDNVWARVAENVLLICSRSRRNCCVRRDASWPMAASRRRR